MAEKKIQTRIRQKVDTEANWNKATNFIPLKGEIIIYSDLNQAKIGDGTTKVGALPFLKGKADASDKNPTLAWGSKSTVATVDGVDIHVTMPSNPNTHQSIKTLNTNNTSAQTASSSEAIAGSGTINLHKVAKTGSYNDLNNKPTIPSKLSQMTNDANYVKSTDDIDADTLAGKTYSQIESMINQKQNSSAFLDLIEGLGIQGSGFLHVYQNKYGPIAEVDELPKASMLEYGTVKLTNDVKQSVSENSISSTASRTYAIQKNSTGGLVVNVPWTSYTLPDASLNTKGGVKAYFGAQTGGTGNFELWADIQQQSNALYIRAGQFQQTSGSGTTATQFTFKRAMSAMGQASYVAVILGDSYGQATNGQWMGALAVDSSSYSGFSYRAANGEKGHVYYIAIGRK